MMGRLSSGRFLGNVPFPTFLILVLGTVSLEPLLAFKSPFCQRVISNYQRSNISPSMKNDLLKREVISFRRENVLKHTAIRLFLVSGEDVGIEPIEDFVFRSRGGFWLSHMIFGVLPEPEFQSGGLAALGKSYQLDTDELASLPSERFFVTHWSQLEEKVSEGILQATTELYSKDEDLFQLPGDASGYSEDNGDPLMGSFVLLPRFFGTNSQVNLSIIFNVYRLIMMQDYLSSVYMEFHKNLQRQNTSNASLKFLDNETKREAWNEASVRMGRLFSGRGFELPLEMYPQGEPSEVAYFKETIEFRARGFIENEKIPAEYRGFLSSVLLLTRLYDLDFFPDEVALYAHILELVAEQLDGLVVR